MSTNKETSRVLTLKDIWEYMRRPAWLLLFGILASYMAFQAGINYSRQHVQVNSITRNLAFIEIAGEEHLYELDWTEETPIYWNR